MIVSLVGAALAARPVRGQDASPAASPAARAGVLGDCTLEVSHAQLWRSAILGGPRGASPDGFDGLTTRVTLQLACGTDARLTLRAGTLALDGGATHPLRSPERRAGDDDRPWDGRVVAGVPIEVGVTYRNGPFVPRGSAGRVVLRFARAHTGTLELATPAVAVAFVS